MDNQKTHWAWVIIAAPLLSIIHVLIFAWRSGRIDNTLTGYLIGIPFAFLGSLLLPLALPLWIGATLGGALPWLLATWIGYHTGNGNQPSR